MCPRIGCESPINESKTWISYMHPLDNSVWKALSTRQSGLAESFGEARRFVPEISTLGAFVEPTDQGYDSLATLLAPGEIVNLALEAPYQPRPGWSFVFGGPMLQMVHQGNGAGGERLADGKSIIELGAADAAEMMELTTLTKPGPFAQRTHELGTYLGIRQDGKLIAMAGERLKIPGFTEVSAVCTHPEHAGKGYARILMAEIMRRIRDRGETPFLHVRESNGHAIALYEKLGFTKRVQLQHVVLCKDGKK
jgi:ribosomal protein S18 acetylase RimI-like enzyme